jgi:hypothetical protein
VRQKSRYAFNGTGTDDWQAVHNGGYGSPACCRLRLRRVTSGVVSPMMVSLWPGMQVAVAG